MPDSSPPDAPAPAPSSSELAYTAERVAEFLEDLVADFKRLADLDPELRQRLVKAAGRLARPGPWAKRELAREARRRHEQEMRRADDAVLARTGIRVGRQAPVFQTPLLATPPALTETELRGRDSEHVLEPRTCYVCKVDYRELHHFYDQMCPSCARFNWDKRNQTADLSGRVALVTGGRVKIGYMAAIKLLRAGAHVVVTTRFPADAAARFAREPDFDDWRHRVEVYGVDLRHTPSVEGLCRHLLGHLDRLDFILNNACQTVRRPAGFYDHLLNAESRLSAQQPERVRPLLRGHNELVAGGRSAPEAHLARPGAPGPQVADSVALSQLALLGEDLHRGEALFPRGQLDADLQQVDLRGRNSWRLALDEISAVELLEVQLVNAVAPFVINARLKPLMTRVPSRDKHIVNVSAMEGQFYRRFKTDKHPHTNMAKAALNMMTRTSAADYVRDGIHMNSVDTGWVTDEDPVEIARRKTSVHRFHPPLDIVDGAARICDPIFDGLNTGRHVWGQFLKDYEPTDW